MRLLVGNLNHGDTVLVSGIAYRVVSNVGFNKTPNNKPDEVLRHKL